MWRHESREFPINLPSGLDSPEKQKSSEISKHSIKSSQQKSKGKLEIELLEIFIESFMSFCEELQDP
jgi:hypothetical protein